MTITQMTNFPNSIFTNITSEFLETAANLNILDGRKPNSAQVIERARHLAARAIDITLGSPGDLANATRSFTAGMIPKEISLVETTFKAVFAYIPQLVLTDTVKDIGLIIPTSRPTPSPIPSLSFLEKVSQTASNNKVVIGAAVATLIGVVAYRTLFMGDAQKSEKTLGERISIALQPATALSKNLLSKIW